MRQKIYLFLLKMCRWLKWYLLMPPCKLSLIRIFKNKTIAIVGSSADLHGKKLGNIIDQNDIVVRVNMPRNTQDSINFGKRSDVVFIGAIITNINFNKTLSERINSETIIISIRNNRDVLKRFNHLKKVFQKGYNYCVLKRI